ncbi:MAG: hypothetical protein IJT70_03250 [Clostridia bacterium]|nr:hypothetical protein [Clostridia bacterium]
MKKLYLITLIPTALVLTSCDVHFGSKHYDWPWWAVALVSLAIIVPTITLGCRYICKYEYVCSKCKNEFHPTWRQALFSAHIGSDRAFKCPVCGHRGFCKRNSKK